MNPFDFITKIKQVVYESAVSGSLSLLQKPPGRRPSPKLTTLAQWYNQLSEPEKEKIYSVVELVAKQTSFAMLAVLDGVRQIDDCEKKGVLELRYTKDGHTTLLNDPNTDYLHDLFNKQVPPT